MHNGSFQNVILIYYSVLNHLQLYAKAIESCSICVEPCVDILDPNL